MTSLKKQIAYNTFYLSVSANLQKAISLFVFFLLVTNLSVHEYGVLALLFTIPDPLSSILNIGIGALVVSEIAKARGQKKYSKIKGLLIQYFRTGIIFFLIFFVLSFVFKNYLTDHYNLYLAKYYNIIIFYILGQYLSNFFNNLLRSYEEFFKSSFVSVLEPFVRLVALFVLFTNSGITTKNAFLVYAISKWTSALLAFILSLGILKKLLTYKTEGKILQKLVKTTGKWLIFKNIIDKFTANIVPWLIKIFLTTEAIAIYRVTSKIYSTLVRLLPFDSVLFPLISRNIKNTKIISLIVQKARKYYYIFSFLAVATIWLLTGPIITKFLPNYIEVILLIQILSLRLFANGMSLGQTGILYAYNRQKFIFKFFIYGITQRILLYVLFLKFFGLIGLVSVVVVHVFIMTVIKNVYIRKYVGLLKYKMKDYFKYDEYDQMIIKAFIKKLSKVKKV